MRQFTDPPLPIGYANPIVMRPLYLFLLKQEFFGLKVSFLERKFGDRTLGTLWP
jgi:hypothetical protein